MANTYYSHHKWVPKQNKTNWWTEDYTKDQRKPNQGEKGDNCARQHELIQTLLENYISMVQKQESLHEHINVLQSQVIHLTNCLSWTWNGTATTASSNVDETGWVTLENETTGVTPPTHHHQHTI